MITTIGGKIHPQSLKLIAMELHEAGASLTATGEVELHNYAMELRTAADLVWEVAEKLIRRERR